MIRTIVVAVTAAACMIGCGSSAQFAAIPPGMDRATVPQVSIDVFAQRYEFRPEVIRVKPGTLVTLKITAADGTHGFDLGDFGIDERLEEGQVKLVQFYVPRAGVFEFHCSHFCGIGHFGMSGKIVAE